MNERQKSSVSIGPGAASLILIFVMLSMSVLAMLSVMTGRSDLRLSERSIEVAQEVYALQEKAEESYASLAGVVRKSREESGDENTFLMTVAGALPEGMALENADGRFAVGWFEEDETRSLDCAVLIGTYEDAQMSWLRHDLTAGTEDEWNW